MSGQLWFMLGVGVLAGGGLGSLIARRGRSIMLARCEEVNYKEGRADGLDYGWDQALMRHGLITDDDDPVKFGQIVEPPPSRAEPPPAVVGHTIYPELAALAALDVPEPASAGVATREPSGLGHPSPYTGPLTPAQRRRDKHKQRGPYAVGDLPDPPTDVGAWWQAELDALLEDGQSEWLTRNLAGAA